MRRPFLEILPGGVATFYTHDSNFKTVKPYHLLAVPGDKENFYILLKDEKELYSLDENNPGHFILQFRETPNYFDKVPESKNIYIQIKRHCIRHNLDTEIFNYYDFDPAFDCFKVTNDEKYLIAYNYRFISALNLETGTSTALKQVNASSFYVVDYCLLATKDNKITITNVVTDQTIDFFISKKTIKTMFSSFDMKYLFIECLSDIFRIDLKSFERYSVSYLPPVIHSRQVIYQVIGQGHTKYHYYRRFNHLVRKYYGIFYLLIKNGIFHKDIFVLITSFLFDKYDYNYYSKIFSYCNLPAIERFKTKEEFFGYFSLETD